MKLPQCTRDPTLSQRVVSQPSDTLRASLHLACTSTRDGAGIAASASAMDSPRATSAHVDAAANDGIRTERARPWGEVRDIDRPTSWASREGSALLVPTGSASALTAVSLGEAAVTAGVTANADAALALGCAAASATGGLTGAAGAGPGSAGAEAGTCGAASGSGSRAAGAGPSSAVGSR